MVAFADSNIRVDRSRVRIGRRRSIALGNVCGSVFLFWRFLLDCLPRKPNNPAENLVHFVAAARQAGASRRLSSRDIAAERFQPRRVDYFVSVTFFEVFRSNRLVLERASSPPSRGGCGPYSFVPLGRQTQIANQIHYDK